VSEAIEKFSATTARPHTVAPTPTAQPFADPGGEPTPHPGLVLRTASPTTFPNLTPVSLESYQTQFKTTRRTWKRARHGGGRLPPPVEISLLQRSSTKQVTADVPNTAEMIRVRHILVSIRAAEPTPMPTPTGQPTATPLPAGEPTPAPTATPLPPRDDAQALARIARCKAEAGCGRGLAKLVTEYLDPRQRDTGGDIRWVARRPGPGSDLRGCRVCFLEIFGKCGGKRSRSSRSSATT